MEIATHPGNFHADEVFAVATLRLALGDLGVVRTRDTRRQARSDIRVDVGGRSDPLTGDFDHHQKGGAGERPNGVLYASFGLVWREHGTALAGGDAAAAAIDERLVQGIDANDNGQTITEALVDGIVPMTVSGVIAARNAAWDEELTPEQEDERFVDAVEFASVVLRGQLAGAAAFDRARQIVLDAIAAATDPRVVELPGNMPWRQIVVSEAPGAVFVVYPKSDGWGMQAVPAQHGSFDNRLDLPEAWAGLSDAELQAVTGVDDAVFAHTAGFYASAASREGILALAALALDA
jgi:uncharacterized UPF0160 family protein